MLHFLTESHWDVQVLRSRRLGLISQVVQGRKIYLIIDETEDNKKGQATDYVDRQYIGNLGKIENGIVSVNAYGMIEGIAFPLLFKIYKPRKQLKAEVGNSYRLRTWVEYGFKHCKNDLGWADFRDIDFEQIEGWWEIVSSTYLMVSLQFDGLHQSSLHLTTFDKIKYKRSSASILGDVPVMAGNINLIIYS